MFLIINNFLGMVGDPLFRSPFEGAFDCYLVSPFFSGKVVFDNPLIYKQPSQKGDIIYIYIL